MRNQRMLTIVTGIVSLLAILVYVLSKACEGNIWKSLTELSLAVFGSALLGFIMSLSSYFSAKQQEIADFITVVEDYSRQFYLIAPLQIQIPRELYKTYLYDKKEDASDQLFDSLERKKVLRKNTQRNLTVENLLLQWTRQTVYEHYTEDQICETKDERLENARDQISWVSNMYRNLPNMDVKNVVDKKRRFAFFGKSEQKLINDVVSDLNCITTILNSAATIMKRANPKENLFYQLKRIEDIEQKLFETVEWKEYPYEDDQGMFTYQICTVRNKILNDMEKKITQLRKTEYDETSASWDIYVISPNQ